MEWEKAAKDLWAIIDDIDTYSDMVKQDDIKYRELVEIKQRERFKILESDGYKLYVPGTMPENTTAPVKAGN